MSKKPRFSIEQHRRTARADLKRIRRELMDLQRELCKAYPKPVASSMVACINGLDRVRCVLESEMFREGSDDTHVYYGETT